MAYCLEEQQQQLVCKDMGLVVNTFETTDCCGISPRVMLSSFTLGISVSPEVMHIVVRGTSWLRTKVFVAL